MRILAFAVVPFVLSSVTAPAQLLIETPLSVTVDEHAIRASLQNGPTVVSVPINSSLDRPVRSTLLLEWLGTGGVLTSAEQQISIDPGRTLATVPLGIPHPTVWLRLRYTLTPDRGDARSFTRQSGIVSLPHIADHVFEVKVSYSGTPRRGEPFTVYAQAVHPVTRVVVPDVDWKGQLTLGDTDIDPVNIVLHQEGVAEISFLLPKSKPGADNDDEEGDVTVTARRGDFEQEASVMVISPDRPSARLQTDKPIYQPGQTIHIRSLITTPEGKAADSSKVTLRITHDFNDLVHRADLVSSHFGIVHEDWTLPANAEPGNYQIVLTAEGDEHFQFGNHTVRVSRYDLPEFTVTAKPNRTAYLPAEDPSVTVTGAYLFGKPVPKGHVKVTRFGEPVWNPRTRRSETNDVAVAEGEAGEDGSFTAHLNVREDQRDRDENKRFEDLHFAAYYTDPLSRRTEQRKFDIRITREPIHIYIIGQPAGPLPAPVYVSTDYADGKPAQCDVEIRLAGQIVRVRTNPYGVGKAYLQSVPERPSDMQIRATDSAGKTGTWTERYFVRGSERVRIETGRTLYRTGESISLDISTPPAIGGADSMIVTAVAGEHTIARQIIRLVNGKAQVVFPWQHEFRRTVTFLAWNGAFGKPQVEPDSLFGGRTVIFPDASDLRVTAAADRSVYRPGDKSTLRFHVSTADGKPAQAALGLAIVDEAVIERARTDADFGHRSWFSCAFCGDAGETEIGGVRLNDLYSLKPSAAVTPELDLVAEALVGHNGAFIGSESSEDFTEKPEFAEVKAQMKQLLSTLERHFADKLNFPADEAELAAAAGKDWTAIRDPWGLPYTARFTFDRDQEIIEIVSSGPDKKAGTEDDYVAGNVRQPYFALYNALIAGVLKGREEYPATVAEFQAMLRERGLLLETMRDPWGTPYRAKVETHAAQRMVSITSAGPDRMFGTDDDFQIAGYSGAYFQRERRAIAEALRKAPSQPQTLEEFERVLKDAAIDVSGYRDAWGRPYRFVTRTFSRFADRVDSTNIRTFGTPTPAIRTTVTPVTEHVIAFALRSDGPDGMEGTWDDFDIASFPVILKQESSESPSAPLRSATLLRGSGVIFGTVTDASGAVVPNARVVLMDSAGESYEIETSQDGTYEFASVPAGVYSLRASSPGFRIYEIDKVPVAAGNGTAVDVTLQVGATSETVTVSAEALPLQTMSAEIAGGPVATPRVRDYFPETLLWLPEIVTDAAGNASAPLTLADSVTTWRIAAFASTLDGRVAESESDIRTFQPFFLDFNPPAALTDGDRVELPVTVRNYRDHEQKVAVEAHPGDSLSVDGARTKQVQVPANRSVNVAWTVQAKGLNDAARERISATAGRDRDAIEKTLSIHPDGQLVTQTQGDLFTGRAAFGLTIPPAAIAGASRAELRLYPNIASLLLESAAAILNTPHGCAEQTISTGYASLIALRYSKSVGITDPRVTAKALANVTAARDALAGFITDAHGVSYWSGGEPDVAVTAYAIRFLLDTSTVLPIDRDQLEAMVQWLEKQQQTNGAWAAPRIRDEDAVTRQDVLLTALVMRSLAAAQKSGMQVRADVMAAGWHHIATLTDRIDEPYMLAQFLLGALDSGDNTLLGDAAKRLAAAAHGESGGLYWDIRTNSPFYGWGTAGRFETTALVVSALSAWRLQRANSPEFDTPIKRGLFFLLRNRDRFGGWSSTQATVNAMQAVVDAAPALGGFGTGGGPIDIRSNGHLLKTISIPAGNRDVDPILVDVSTLLAPGENHIELTSRGAQGSLMLTRLSSDYWLPWSQTKPRTSPELRMNIHFESTESVAGAPVRCEVRAERVGFKGYGMMMAEIGLPPGADVDRASLQKLVDDSSLGISRYDVLPDRVVFYVWPKAGGASFEFVLRGRMSLLAKSAASMLYDYYNPEAVAEVPPVDWHIN